MSFTLLETRVIPEIASTAKLYRHDQSGARLLSVLNADENKVFGITFRTPPQTSNGIAHIMEHSVLCGSRKYPVKEPFIELAKSSLNTFLNAFTYPDKTCYPVASANLKDFYNLIDVYLDAVFYPRLEEETLKQEGWHYELESPEAHLTFKGVVFNEMKGALSSPDDLLDEYSQQAVYPDTPYGLNSGGDPQVIPFLTYQEFLNFHRTYYHPSNAYIYFYGDDPEEERLRLLEEWLKDFASQPIHSRLPLQPAWDSPRQRQEVYDAGEEQDSPKSYLTINWLMPRAGDQSLSLSLSLLSYILLATPASPLRKTLIDSGLGEDVTGGYQDGLLQGYFSAGMKGISPENLSRVETLILDTLRSLAQNGLDPQTVAASLNTLEFRLREQNTGRFPRGLALMLSALDIWLYDENPLDALAFEKPLQAVKQSMQTPRFFEELIENHLLNNPHRVTLRLLPDAEEGKRKEAAEAGRLAAYKQTLDPQALQKLVEETETLKRRQQTPDSPAALATIPALTLADIEKQERSIPVAEENLQQARLFYHPLPTNGILYLDLGFDLRSLPADLLPYLGFWGRVWLQMGTQKQDFVSLIQRIGQNTGGIHSGTLLSSLRQQPGSALYFFLRGKSTLEKAEKMFDILSEVLLQPNLSNRERLRQIVMEEKADAEAGLIPSGHAVVGSRLNARFSESGWVAERLGGLENLFFLRRLAEELENDWPGVLAKLQQVHNTLLNRSGMVINVTTDQQGYEQIFSGLKALVSSLPAAPQQPQAYPWRESAASQAEGWALPSQVNYVGKGANLYALGYQPHGSVSVIRNYLGTTWLWEKVRVQGGAYGGFSTFDINSGTFAYLSYRDPNVLSTLQNYDATPQFLRSLELSPSELEKSIIGAIGDIDAYQLPDAKGWTSMARILTGYSDEMRQKNREEVLSTSLQDFHRFAETLEALREAGQVVVLGSTEALEKANREGGNWLKIEKAL